MKPMKNHKLLIGNILFVLVGAAILIFLFSAPKETTSHLPHDAIHSRFYDIQGKKEAEKFCLDCHDQDKEAPLPDGHPPKYRCLFCHKRL
jgi:hypothetical protein